MDFEYPAEAEALLRTRAEDTGAGFKINGQKIWTSYAAPGVGDANVHFTSSHASASFLMSMPAATLSHSFVLGRLRSLTFCTRIE